MKLFSGSREKFVNLLTQASFINIFCVSPCQQDHTRDCKMTQNLIRSNLNKTNLETLRTWLCHISKDKDLTVKMRVSTPQELGKRLIVSRQMVFAHFVILCLRLWAASIFTVHVRKHNLLLLQKISKAATERKKWTRWENSTSKKKDILLLKYGNVNGGISIRRQRILKNIWENHFLTHVHWEERDFWNE